MTGDLPVPLRGPSFGTFEPEEVAWLLTDLSAFEIEAPVERRERDIQAGGHYSESLPVEYQPPAEYVEIFRDLVRERSESVALWLGVLGERLHRLHGPDIVLVSLARAGTPVGVLLRDWLQHSHGYAPAHYSLSIIRDKGIDPLALAWLRRHHDPRHVVFVDGWTGKGVISRELAAAVADEVVRDDEPRFDPALAVVADPGGCSPVFGTRDDLMIPSACLNSTTCGLVSRTVHSASLIGPGQFHGAKFYADLAHVDETRHFLDGVRAWFGAVAPRVAAVVDAEPLESGPTWVGWSAVEQLAATYGVTDLNLVKPGIGETTRVLLRRVPWKVVVRDTDAPEIAHVVFLARQRGVQVDVVPGLPFACVGVIRDLQQG